ncbi:MAG: LysM peptidoglycan-binding domain-containing protein [Candidatus Spechtbacterales bacterium]|nr:LysM peptidoglycan-binding domain-containing protein [Candidatus Spechtbacterales bacterium]
MSDIKQLVKAVCIKSAERTLFRIKGLYAKINRKGEASFFLLSIKGGAAVLFLIGLTGGYFQQDFNTVLPVHSGEEEVKVASLDARDRTTGLFLSARLSTLETSENKNEDSAIGGSSDPSLPTLQGNTLLAYNPVSIPEAPPQDRQEIAKYTVKPGDTATGIASSFGISLNTLLWSNHFNSPHYIRPGEELIILPFDGVLHEVQTGDTVSSIASAYKSTTSDILEANDIESAQHIFAGQTIIIPGGIKPSRSTAPSTRTSTPRYASQPNLNGYFLRPTSGRISQGLHLKNAVDIANSCWTPIIASASGTVNIASSGGYGRFSNGGYGGYALINHPNGTRTLYAHMIKVEVYAGQHVQQGQIIGRMGGRPGTFGAGRSTGCHLHWEVHGARNPMAY